jgi:hypothetical protein
VTLREQIGWLLLAAFSGFIGYAFGRINKIEREIRMGERAMICWKCTKGEHRRCPGGTWCDCQHRVESEPAK